MSTMSNRLDTKIVEGESFNVFTVTEIKLGQVHSSEKSGCETADPSCYKVKFYGGSSWVKQ